MSHFRWLPTVSRAKALRKRQTDAEAVLWKHLRDRRLGDHKFRRQQPLGPYIVDFVCFEKRLIVELDGGQHNQRSAADADRDAWLESQGYQVLRFWNNEVFRQAEAVKEVIAEALLDDGRDSPSLPLWGEG